MTLLAPAAMWFLLTIVAVAAVFLIKRRVAVVEIPSLEFWERLLKYDALGRWGGRLKRWISLTLHVLVVILLVAALTNPVNSAYKNEFLVLLDDSATMQTREDDGRSRFEHALDALMSELNQAPAGVDVTIVLAADPPKVLTRSETIKRQVQATLNECRPRDCRPDFDQALNLLRRLRTDDASPILAVSDRYFAHDADAHWIKIGSPRPNLGVADVHPSHDSTALEVVLAHHQMSPRTAAIKITPLNYQSNTIAQAVQVLQQSPVVVSIPVNFQSGDAFKIQVDPPDDFTLDNTAYAVWPPQTQTRLNLVTSNNIFLEAALDQPDADLTITPPDQWRYDLDADVHILDATRYKLITARPGQYIIFGGADPFGLCRSAAPAADLSPSQWTAEHALIRDLDPLQWRIDQTAGLIPPAQARPIITADGLPLVFTLDLPGVLENPDDDFKAVYINFDLAHSNLAYRADLPVLLWNAIDYLLDKRPEDALASLPVGAPLLFPTQSQTAAVVVDPAGRELQAWRDGARHVLPFTEYVGLYETKSTDSPCRRAVNYFADAEPNNEPANASRSLVYDAAPRPPIWLILATVAGLLILLEAALNHRGALTLD